MIEKYNRPVRYKITAAAALIVLLSVALIVVINMRRGRVDVPLNAEEETTVTKESPAAKSRMDLLEIQRITQPDEKGNIRAKVRNAPVVTERYTTEPPLSAGGGLPKLSLTVEDYREWLISEEDAAGQRDIESYSNRPRLEGVALACPAKRGEPRKESPVGAVICYSNNSPC